MAYNPDPPLVREAVYQALADLVFGDAGIQAYFKTTGRLLPHESDVDTSNGPALFMFQLPEVRIQKGPGIPAIRTLRVSFVGYFSTQEGGPLPATMINYAADAIDNAVTKRVNPQNIQTLGGLVQHVYIAPTINPFEGLLQQRSVVVATVEMLVP